ncbi:MAG TPA: alpha/beta fold hydrolase [Thermoleophilaceae bacterium]
MLLLTTAIGAAFAASASAKTHWLCKPGTNASFCAPPLTTTNVSPTGDILGTQTIKRDKNPKYDCFYVYPTVSDQTTQTATFAIDPEEKSIVLYQASRYTQHCRLFAPVYRQLTLQGINAGGGSSTNTAPPSYVYTDVRDAWRDYLKNFNDGRPVVLIGHSQGTFVLRQLIAQEIDPKASVRSLLVSGLLMGGNVLVPQGQSVGGDFKHIPGCRSPNQFGCIVAYSTFDGPVPPNSLFGRSTNPADEVLCTDPAALGAGNAPLNSIYPSAPFAPGTTLGAATPLVGIPQVSVPTTYIATSGAYDSSCVDTDGSDVMQVSAQNGAPLLNPVPDATWGLHLTDANIAQGTEVALVQRQFRAYERRNAAK